MKSKDRRTWAAVLVVALSVIYIVLWVIPRPVALSYASKRTCIAWLTLFPGVHRTVNEDQFSVSTEGGIALGSFRLLSTRTCVSPLKSPRSGTVMVATAPFGGWVFQQRMYLTTASPPSMRLAVRGPIPASRPLQFDLSKADRLFTYTIKIDKKVATCKVVPGRSILSCDLASLKLVQGHKYRLEILRSFKGESTSTVFAAAITTLTATTVVDGSVKSGDTVYAKPTELTFTTDKPLKSASAVLTREGEKAPLKVSTSVKDKMITVRISEELVREKAYTLKIAKLEADDGSSLIEPYVVEFRTSGGPKVVNVSVGKTGVATNARVVVTFDQPLSATQDIGKFVAISGAAAHITRSGDQVIYTLNAGLCTPFTLTVAKGVLSSYDIASTAAWSYSSRTICHTTSVYGYSVRGRALVAYTFGTGGPTTMYVGAIHGNEASSGGLMRAWADALEADPGLYAGKRVVVVPTINPDGLAMNSRMNARNVNLNRNFPTDGWVKDINDTDGHHAGGGGSAPLSEPEAQALAGLTTSVRPRLLLSFHAVGSLVSGDPGGYSAGYAAKYAAMVGYRDTTDSSGGGFDYDITGAYENWAAAKQGIPSMVIELGSYGYYSFSHHKAALRAMLD